MAGVFEIGIPPLEDQVSDTSCSSARLHVPRKVRRAVTDGRQQNAAAARAEFVADAEAGDVEVGARVKVARLVFLSVWLAMAALFVIAAVMKTVG